MAKFDTREKYMDFVKSSNDWVKKDDFLVSLATNRSVLDLGFVDHTLETIDALGTEWLHGRLREVASHIEGVDIEAEVVAALRERGLSNLFVLDAENFDLGRTFNVVIAGDLIEHLSNPGSFLHCVKRHMNKGSIFAFSTPNPFSIDRSLNISFEKEINVHSQHTCWVCPKTAWELLTRHGLEVVDFKWASTRFQPCFWSKQEAALYALTASEQASNPLTRSDFIVVCKLGVE